MNSSRFTVSTLLFIAIIVSAIGFFFSVTMVQLAYHPAINAFYPIEDSDLAIRYSSLKPSGLYKGGQTTGILKLEGEFGYDWGAALEGETLYLNEYRTTTLGLMLCDVVRVELGSYSKELLLEDTVLRGRCASGELVCVSGALLPSDFPETSGLCRLYTMSEASLRPGGAQVLFLDPKTGEILCSVCDESVHEKDFEARYLNRTLEEVRG